MNSITSTQSGIHQPAADQFRSLGAKLIFVCVLALLMTIPSFFVGGLVTERSDGPSRVIQESQNHETNATIPGSTIRLVASYRSIDRSLKYVLLFLGLVFVTYFVFEAMTGKRVHPAQYILVGLAQLIFYLLLLSFGEKIGFDFAFLIAGAATVTLLSVNAGWVFLGQSQAIRSFAIFSLLYIFIYLLLRLEQDVLLIGAVASFLAVACVMYATRKLDWYTTLSTVRPFAPPPSPSEMTN